MKPPPDPGTLVAVGIACELTGASAADVRQWIADGSVYSERVGKHIYVSLEDVERALQAKGGAA